MKGLTEIQNELKAPKNQYNSFGKYKYRSCEDILEALKPLLLKHKLTLVVTDDIKEVGGLVFVEAIAEISNEGTNVKKEVVSVKAQAGINPDRKGMDIAQSFGSSSSYARKYALNGLFLIDDTKDADATNDHGKGVKEQTKAKPELKPKSTEWSKAVQYLVDGGLISAIEGKYAITEVNKTALMDDVLK